jgi:hypothetical protein
MRAVITFLILLFCSTLSAQTNPGKVKAKIDSLKKLGRDSLIKLAVAKEKGLDAKGYDRIVVKAYEDKLVVEFSLSVKLVDGSCYYDQVWVALVGSGTGRGIQGDCNETKYHKFSAKEKKKVQFVFDAINKSDEIGHMKDNAIPAGAHMTITEKLTCYLVEMSDWSTHSEYKVDKLTGKISNASHKHYAHSDEEKDDFEIVK